MHHATMTLASLALALVACKTDKSDEDVDDTAWDIVDCSDADFTVPSPRAEQDGVWDAARERLVFFGGDEGMPESCIPKPIFLEETWAFNTDCGDFELIDVGGGPPARTRLATTLDAARNQMIVHGGRSREGDSGNYDLHDDLWAFDLETDTWTELPNEDGPAARAMHTIGVSGDVLYLYGGQLTGSSTTYRPSSELWSYDLEGGTWTEVGDDVDAGDRLFHSMAMAADGSKLWAYGGADENALLGPFFGDLWELDIASGDWEELHSGRNDAPEARIWGDLVHDAGGDRLLLWAGHDDGSLGNTNEVWAFDLGSGAWSMLEEGDVQTNNANGFCDFPADFTDIDPDAPERRYAGVAAFTGSELMVFGGKTDCGQTNDLWSYDPEQATWMERSAATFGEVCLRTTPEEDCSTLCY